MPEIHGTEQHGEAHQRGHRRGRRRPVLGEVGLGARSRSVGWPRSDSFPHRLWGSRQPIPSSSGCGASACPRWPSPTTSPRPSQSSLDHRHLGQPRVPRPHPGRPRAGRRSQCGYRSRSRGVETHAALHTAAPGRRRGRRAAVRGRRTALQRISAVAGRRDEVGVGAVAVGVAESGGLAFLDFAEGFADDADAGWGVDGAVCRGAVCRRAVCRRAMTFLSATGEKYDSSAADTLQPSFFPVQAEASPRMGCR